MIAYQITKDQKGIMVLRMNKKGTKVLEVMKTVYGKVIWRDSDGMIYGAGEDRELIDKHAREMGMVKIENVSCH